MRILFVGHALPFPPNNGQRLRNLSLLRALSEEGHQVTLVSFAEPHEVRATTDALTKLCQDIRHVPAPFTNQGPWRSFLRRLQSLCSPLPHGAWRRRSARMKAAVEEKLAREKFDLIICDDVYNFHNLPMPSPVTVVVNKHDLTHVILRRFISYESNPLKKVYAWLEYWKVRRLERNTCCHLGKIMACSDADRRLLEAFCSTIKVAIVPNAVDTEEYAPAPDDDGTTLLYAGAMDWYPNQDAVQFFILEILPKIQKLVPGVKFAVAGRNASGPFCQRFGKIPGVKFTGTIPDMRIEIAKAAVCVIPLRIGSGTRLKILEAGAMCKAIVSTRVGAEGLDLIDGEEIVLADEPDGFANAVARLLADPLRRRAIGLAARRRVQNQYNLAALRAAVHKAIEKFRDEEVWARRDPDHLLCSDGVQL